MSNSDRDTPKSWKKKRQGRRDQSGDPSGVSQRALIHELNNLLNVVLGNLEMLEESTEGDTDASSRAREAIDAIIEAADVTERLRASLPRAEVESDLVDPGNDAAGADNFPRRAAEGKGTRSKPERPGDPPTGNETILVVDDEQFVRMIAVRILENLGYRVLDAEDGQSALAIIEGDETIDLLLTDVLMPGGMNGGELAREVRERRPDVKVLFVSAHTRKAITQDNILDEGAELIKKPYRKDTLAHDVRRVLDG